MAEELPTYLHWNEIIKVILDLKLILPEAFFWLKAKAKDGTNCDVQKTEP